MEAEKELDGLDMVKRYKESVEAVSEERKRLEDERRSVEERIYDFEKEPITDERGNVLKDKNGEVRYTERRRLKEEFKGNMTDEKRLMRQETDELLSELEDAITRNRLEGIEASYRFNDEMSEVVEGGKSRAQEFRDAQKERKDGKRVDGLYQNDAKLLILQSQRQSKMADTSCMCQPFFFLSVKILPTAINQDIIREQHVRCLSCLVQPGHLVHGTLSSWKPR